MKRHIKDLIWLYEGELFLIITDEEGLRNSIMQLQGVRIDGCTQEKLFWHFFLSDGQLCDDLEII